MDGPLWFIRDLIVLTLLAPIVYLLVRKLQLVWLAIALIGYVSRSWIPFVGFSPVGAFFFSLGATLQIRGNGLLTPFYRFKKWYLGFSLALLVLVLFCYWFYPEFHVYAVHIFTPIGSIGLICLTAFLTEKSVYKESLVLSESSFMVFALHGIGLLYFISWILSFIRIEFEFWYILKYFIVAASTTIVCVCMNVLLKKRMPFVHGLLTGFRYK